VTRSAEQHGLLDLGFRADRQRVTHLARRTQRFPLRMTTPLRVDDADPGMAFVIVQNPTGGVFAGDRLELRVAAGPDARVHVRTQSATKVYDMAGGSAESIVDLEIADGAYLEYVPDPVIPQAGASLTQRTTIAVTRGGTCFAAETVAAGRVARGEAYAFERVRFETRVLVAGEVACHDVADLQPGRRSPRLAGMLGGADQLSTFFCVCPHADVDALAGRIDARLGETVGDRGAAGPLPGGAGVIGRIMSSSAIDARRALQTVWDVARRELVGAGVPRRFA
jgi:urease accessory protein